MANTEQNHKTLLAAIAQACKNIIWVTAPLAAACDFANQENVADNINMNIVIISEMYAKLNDDVKARLASVNWPEIKRNIDLITADYRNADNRVLFYVSKSLIPRLKERIDQILS
ncbi:MAG: hypothetical protein IKR94_06840 [Bacteroidales bacterium]|nr:hypothetical protein [Bacteroidales bacterium]MBR4215020.1 hypothetical protein [Bacteroidales bacterium]